MTQALGYPTCRLGLMVLEMRGFWTEASACVLHCLSVVVQVFRVICRYMCSPGTVGELQSQRYHGNSLPGLHKLKERRVKGHIASGVQKMSKGTRLKSNTSRRVTMDVEVNI